MTHAQSLDNQGLIRFYSALEVAFPETSTYVFPRKSTESYLNELCHLYFGGNDWRRTSFPDDENGAVAAAFDLLDEDAKMYYIAAYMRESMIDSYYQFGCLTHLRALSKEQLQDACNVVRSTIATYCDLVESEAYELPLISRVAHLPTILLARHVKAACHASQN